MPDLLIRASLALGFVLVGVFSYWVINAIILRRLRKPASGIEDMVPGTPVILYFTTPDCQPCATQQRPALMSLSEELGAQVQIFQVDATQRPELADYWGVLSVPTTFIIDSNGQPRGVNHGVASAEKLRRQLEAAAGRPMITKPKARRSFHSPVIDRN